MLILQPNISFDIWNKLGPLQVETIAENTFVAITFDSNIYEIKEQNKNGNPETFKKG
jgi:beta-lactamase class D